MRKDNGWAERYYARIFKRAMMHNSLKEVIEKEIIIMTHYELIKNQRSIRQIADSADDFAKKFKINSADARRLVR